MTACTWQSKSAIARDPSSQQQSQAKANPASTRRLCRIPAELATLARLSTMKTRRLSQKYLRVTKTTLRKGVQSYSRESNSVKASDKKRKALVFTRRTRPTWQQLPARIAKCTPFLLPLANKKVKLGQRCDPVARGP